MIEPALIPAREALGLVTDAISEGVVALTAAGWVEYKHGLAALQSKLCRCCRWLAQPKN
jgi:hypothetical protein